MVRKNTEGLGRSGENRGQNNQARDLGLSKEQGTELWDFIRDKAFGIVGASHLDPKIKFRGAQGRAVLERIFDVIMERFPEMNSVEFTEQGRKALKTFVQKVHDAHRRNEYYKTRMKEERKSSLNRKHGEATEGLVCFVQKSNIFQMN